MRFSVVLLNASVPAAVRFTVIMDVASIPQMGQRLLNILALGTLRVVVDGIDIADSLPQKAKALLVYAARSGRPEGREPLAELLWEDQPPEKSSGSLRMALSRLRTAGAALDITRTTVEFTGWHDANAFEAELRALRPELTNAQPLTCAGAERLDAALQLYGGDFLHGFYIPESSAFDAWLSNQREALRRAYIDAAGLLVDFRLYDRAYADGLALATRLLGVDPLREETHRQLMRLHATGGDRASALKQYESCRQLLNDELGVAPDPDTEALYQQILAGEIVASPRTVVVAAPAPVPQAMPNNLPARLTSFVGRVDVLAEVRARLASARLVTLLGPGGIGKTQLALEAATAELDTFPDGVFFVDLAPARLPEQVAEYVRDALGLRDSGDQDTELGIERFVRGKRMLLVLDNFEQVLDASLLVDRLLRTAPELRLIVTSREALDLYGEQVFPVPELPPDEALTLFRERLLAARPTLTLDDGALVQVEAICDRLEGLPLALELAARQASRMSLADLLRGLDHRLLLLRTNARNLPPRQQTLFGAIDWSYGLLTDEEQAVYRRLSVFVGGWTDEAALAVCGADAFTLAELVDKSLVRQQLEPTRRYTMLEMIREHAGEMLAGCNETDDAAAAQADYFLRYARSAAKNWRAAGESQWFDQLEADHENLRAALRWLYNTPGREADYAHLVGALGWFWYRRSHNREAIMQTWKVVARHDEPELLADALAGGGHSAHEIGDMNLATAWHRDALACYHELGDKANEAFMYYCLASHTAKLKEGAALLQQSLALAREAKEFQFQAFGLYGLGITHGLSGQWAQGIAELGEAVALCRLHQLEYEADFQHAQAYIILIGGDPKRAFDLASTAYRYAVEHHLSVLAANTLVTMGGSLLMLGRLEEALPWLEEAQQIAVRGGLPVEQRVADSMLALVLAERGDDTTMVRLYRQSAQPDLECSDLELFTLLLFVTHITAVLGTRGHPHVAAELLQRCNASFEAAGYVPGVIHQHYARIARSAILDQLGAAALDPLRTAAPALEPNVLFMHAVGLLDLLDAPLSS